MEFFNTVYISYMYHTGLVSDAFNSTGRIEALGPGKPGDLCLSLTKDWEEIHESI